MKDRLGKTLKFLKKPLQRLSRSNLLANAWSKFFLKNSLKPKSSLGERPVRVLCAASTGGHQIVTAINSLVSAGLLSRGAEVGYLICDEFLPACELMDFRMSESVIGRVTGAISRERCQSCWSYGREVFANFPGELFRYKELIEESQFKALFDQAQTLGVKEIFGFKWKGVHLGEQIRAAVIRFFGNSNLESERPEHLTFLSRQYFVGAVATAIVTETLIKKWKPDVIFNHHGIYVPQGIIDDVARSMGVRVVVWGTSYRNRTIIASHDQTYHRTFLSEPLSLWTEMEWNQSREDRIISYLEARRRGEGDWPWVTNEVGGAREHKIEELRKLNLDPTKPTFGLLTNVAWDAQIFYSNNAYPDPFDWMQDTFDFFCKRPDLQLIVRIHPHEVKAGNRQYTTDWLKKKYPHQPSNIVVVDHKSDFNTYALMDLCRVVLIYGTKTGVELAPFGKPVVVAGDAWIRGRGFSVDVTSKSEFLSVLEGLSNIGPLTKEQCRRAAMFAYHYFFRRMIPLAGLDSSQDTQMILTLEKLSELSAAENPGLEVICQGILNGREFIFDENEEALKCNLSSI